MEVHLIFPAAACEKREGAHCEGLAELQINIALFGGQEAKGKRTIAPSLEWPLLLL
jgi:hypothetical protein